MKRRRTDGSLTGGTGDVNPQFMSFSVVETGNDTASGGAIQPPVSLSTGENLAMEILKIFVEIPNIASGSQVSVAKWWLSMKNFGTTAPTLGLGDATVIMEDGFVEAFLTSGTAFRNNTVEYDLSDGAGHGMLVGNQNLYWGITSTGTGVPLRVNWKVLYRAKRISDSELLGIVLQSNQN